jgi:cyanate permease
MLLTSRGRAVVSLSIAETISWGVLFYAYPLLISPLSKATRISETTALSLFSIALLSNGLIARRVGRALDRWGAAPVMTAGAILATLSFAMLAFVHRPIELAVVLALIGASHALVLYDPAFFAVTSWFPSYSNASKTAQTRALLLLTIFAGFASTIFVPLTAFLLSRWGFAETVLTLAGMLGLFVFPIHASLPAPSSSSACISTDDNCCVDKDKREEEVERGGNAIALLATIFGIHSFASAAVGVYLISKLIDAGYSSGSAAALVAVMGASQVAGRLLSPLARKIITASRNRIGALLFIQACALLVLAPASPSPILKVIAVIALGATNGMVTLERASTVADRYGASARYGEVSARIARVGLFVRAGAPAVMGLLKDSVGGPLAFALLATVLILGGFFTRMDRA